MSFEKISSRVARVPSFRILTAATAVVCALAALPAAAPVFAQSPAAKPDATAVATLSEIHGKVDILAHGASAKRDAAASGAAVRAGDVIVVVGSGSAQLMLRSTHVMYQLAAGSRVRITDDGKELRPISGPLPRRLVDLTYAAMARGNMPSASEQQRKMEVLEPLLDDRLQAAVSRGGGGGPSIFTPDGLSPRWVVAAAPGKPLTVKWGVQNASHVDTSSRFRVRIFTREAMAPIYTNHCPLDARDLSIPAGTMKPGVWYAIQVSLVDDSGASVPGQQTIGCLRLLTDRERGWLGKKLHEADADPKNSALLRARAFETVGQTDEAIAAYESAKAAGHLSPASDREVNTSLAFLNKVRAATAPGQ